MSEKKFCICRKCGNIVGMIENSGIPVSCCGVTMDCLIPKTADEDNEGREKHVPQVSVTGTIVNVNVGEIPHPMTAEHSIAWVYLHTSKGGHRKSLMPDEKPVLTFCITDELPIAAYSYCNKHGLWKADITAQ